jgi:hypothetical protein
MKRRRRRLLPGVAVLSLVLFLGTAALWVRSCWRRDQIVLYARYYAGTVPHAISFGMADRPYFTDARLYESFIPRRPQTGSYFLLVIHSRDHEFVRFLGFAYSYYVQRSGMPCIFVDFEIPLWFPLVITSLPPIFWILNRRRLLEPGLCLACGYDLRATPDRCPECGTIPPKKEIVST